MAHQNSFFYTINLLYFHKYIIYEPLAHYKNDIAIANTKLNLLIDSSDGDKFYKKLTNSGDSDTSTIKSNKIKYGNRS